MRSGTDDRSGQLIKHAAVGVTVTGATAPDDLTSDCGCGLDNGNVAALGGHLCDTNHLRVCSEPGRPIPNCDMVLSFIQRI